MQTHYPQVNWFSHDAGHLLEMLFGWKANPHFGPFHLLSNVLIFAGFYVTATAWHTLYEAQKKGVLATDVLYQYVRHPQYVGFIAVLTGFLLRWPTLLTIAMYPVLVYMYVRLARREEDDARKVSGTEFDDYAARVPRWFPKVRNGRSPA